MITQRRIIYSMHTNTAKREQTDPLIIGGTQVEYECMYDAPLGYIQSKFKIHSRVSSLYHSEPPGFKLKRTRSNAAFSCQTIFMLIQLNMAFKRILFGFLIFSYQENFPGAYFISSLSVHIPPHITIILNTPKYKLNPCAYIKYITNRLPICIYILPQILQSARFLTKTIYLKYGRN